MESFYFACPYCSGQFAVTHPPPGQAVACPHCGGAVAMPTEVPPPAGAAPHFDEPHPAASSAAPPTQPSVVSHAAVRVVPPQEFDFLEPPPIVASRPASPAALPRALPEARRLTHAEREHRSVVRNLILMAVGVVVLVVVAVVLSRW